MAAAAPRSLRALFNLDWYRLLTPDGRNAFWAATAGYALASFDFLAFTFVLLPIQRSFGIGDAQIGVLATVSLIASMAGGVFGGVLADRLGRARLLRWSVAAYALFSLLSGLAQSYEQLLVVRLLLGLGFGAEWTAGALLIAEYAEPAHRGRVQGVFASALSVGSMLATLAYIGLAAILAGDLVWRALFWLGVLPALLLLWARTRLVDPPVYLAGRAARATARAERAARRPLVTIFQPPLLVHTLAGSLLSSGILSGKYILNIWLPDYVEQARALAGAAAGVQVTAALLGAIVGSLIGGYCLDGLGRRPTFALYSVASAVTYWLYLLVPGDADVLLLLVGVVLGFFTAGAISGLGAYLAELYPSGVRGTGQGFTYNVGRGASGLVTGAIGALVPQLGLSGAIALAAGVYVVSLAALLVLPETRGRSLAPAAPDTGTPPSPGPPHAASDPALPGNEGSRPASPSTG